MSALNEGGQVLALAQLVRLGNGKRGRIGVRWFGFFGGSVLQAQLRRELFLQPLLTLHRYHRIVHAEHLMVAGDNLPCAARPAVVEQDEVLHQVEQAVLRQHAVEQHLGIDAAGVPGLPVRITPLDRHAVADEIVRLTVVLDQRAGEVHPRELLDGLIAGGVGQVGIEPQNGGAEVADEDDIPLAGAAQRAVGAEGLLVVGEDAVPAEDIMKMVGERRLDQPIFIVDVGNHGET